MNRTAFRIFMRTGFVGALCASSLGCGSDGDQSMKIDFVPLVKGSPFNCTSTYSGLGTGKATARPLDFRLYVNDVKLTTVGGESIPFKLENDGIWQRDGVALLDFENDTGTCKTGSAETNVSLVGTAPSRSDYTGLTFAIGVPEAANHLDAATAPAPYNAPGLWWSWQGGFKYARIDIATDANPEGFYFHLGGTNCGGAISTGFSCAFPNIATVALNGFHAGTSHVSLDIGALYEGVDINAKPNFTTDFVAGCMAFGGDPECPAMFSSLGLAFENGPALSSTQSMFVAQ